MAISSCGSQAIEGFGIVTLNDYIYLSSISPQGLRAYTFDGSTYSLAGSIDDSAQPYGICMHGYWIAVAAFTDGLRVYSFDGTDFTLVQNSVTSNAAFVCSNGLQIYVHDIDDGIYRYTWVNSILAEADHNDHGYGVGGIDSGSYYVFAACGADGLVAFGNTDVAEDGKIDDGGYANDVWYDDVNDVIHLANHNDGIRAYTFDGSDFTLVDHVDIGENAHRIWGYDGYIYVSTSNGLYIYTFDGSSYTYYDVDSSTTTGYGLGGNMHYLHLAQASDDVLAYDTLVPTGTCLLNKDHVQDSDGIDTDFIGVHGIGNYIYIASDDGLWAHSFDGTDFTTLDDMYNGHAYDDIFAIGAYIYAAGTMQGHVTALTFDGSDFTEIVSTIMTDGPNNGLWANATHQFITAHTKGLYATTFDGATFTAAGNVNDGPAYAVWGDGTYIYLANGSDGIRAYTYDGATFTGVGHIDDGGSMYSVWGNGTHIFTTDWTNIRAYTFDGSTFTAAGTVSPDGSSSARWTWGDGTYIYCAGGNTGIWVYTYDGATFTEVTHRMDGLSSQGWAMCVWGANDHIYIANFTDGLRAYDLQIESSSNSQVIIFK